MPLNHVQLYSYITSVWNKSKGFYCHRRYFDELGASKNGTLMYVSSFMNVLSEAIVLFTSHLLIARIGHIGAQMLALLAYVVRFVGYAMIPGPWWNLPFDALQGISLGLQLVAMSGHVASIAAPEVQPTAQVRVDVAADRKSVV